MSDPPAVRIADELRESIITGGILPGERLREIALAERFGHSRVPVREALRELAADGYVELRPNAGARVAEPPQADVGVLFDLRIVLESSIAASAAERAARRAGSEAAAAEDAEWEAHWQAARAMLEAGDQAREAGRIQELATWNVRFHNALGALSGRTGFTALLRQLTGRTEWLHAATPRHVLHRGDQAWCEHWQILEHIGAGEAAAAGELMSSHLERSRSTLLASGEAAGAATDPAPTGGAAG